MKSALAAAGSISLSWASQSLNSAEFRERATDDVASHRPAQRVGVREQEFFLLFDQPNRGGRFRRRPVRLFAAVHGGIAEEHINEIISNSFLDCWITFEMFGIREQARGGVEVAAQDQEFQAKLLAKDGPRAPVGFRRDVQTVS